MTVRTYWAWETTLRLLGARGAGVPTGEERGGAYRVAMRTVYYREEGKVPVGSIPPIAHTVWITVLEIALKLVWAKGSVTLQLGRSPLVWQKVTAAYRRVYGFDYLRGDCRGLG